MGPLPDTRAQTWAVANGATVTRDIELCVAKISSEVEYLLSTGPP